MNYYNEHDKNAAAWIEDLVANDDLPPGLVDSRDVQDVGPNDLLHQYNQCHFFSGIAGWPYALDLAGWPRDKPIWTASLPCQPFSDAGKQLGVKDERHLWPVFRDLVAHYRPQYVVGEQVASKAGREWFASLQLEMEDLGYRVGAIDLCAAGFGAPHIRQRLFWCAIRVGVSDVTRLERPDDNAPGPQDVEPGRAGGNDAWISVVYIPCSDGKARPIKSCSESVADGLPGILVSGSDSRTPEIGGGEEGETQDQTPVAGWTTPQAHDPRARGPGNRANPKGGGADLNWDARYAAGWPTPMAGTPAQNGNNEAGNTDSSRRTVALVSGWPTPNTSEGGLTSRSGDRKGELLVGGIARGITAPLDRAAIPPLVSAPSEDLNNTNEARTMRLRGYGNAIVAPLAAEFILAFMDILDDIGA